jgi:hypothetical protein
MKTMKNHKTPLELAIAGMEESGRVVDWTVNTTLTDSEGKKMSFSGKTVVPDTEENHFSTACQLNTVRDGKFSRPSEIAGQKKSQSRPVSGNEAMVGYTRAINAIVEKEVVKERDLPKKIYSPERDEADYENRDFSRGGLIEAIATMEPSKRAEFLKSTLATIEEQLLETEIAQEEQSQNS